MSIVITLVYKKENKITIAIIIHVNNYNHYFVIALSLLIGMEVPLKDNYKIKYTTPRLFSMGQAWIG